MKKGERQFVFCHIIMNDTMSDNKKMLITFFVLFLSIVSYIGVNFYAKSETEKKGIDLTMQCLDYYDNNKHLPQVIIGTDNKFLYDNEHLLIIYNGDLNNKVVVVANYKYDDKSLNSEIWDFVDLFAKDTQDIKNIKYIYGNNIINLNR